MAVTTYAELKIALADWSHRSDLTSYLDDFIDQTESFFNYEPLRPSEPGIGGIRGDITRATGTLSASTLALPSDFLEGYRFDLTGTNGGLLEFVGPEYLTLLKRESNGKPKYWAVSDVIEFDRTPDSNYAYELSYYTQVTALDGSNTSNWILADYPNVYLSGCLFNLYRFIQDAEQANMWLTQYKAGAHAVNQAYQRRRMSQGPIAARVG